MAVTADSVVVELEAKIDRYKAQLADAEAAFKRSMGATEQTGNQTADRIAARRARLAQQLAFSDADAANKLSQSLAGVDRDFRRVANAQRNLGRQFADVGASLASGSSPFVVLAQQSGQVADALSDTGGRAAKVAQFFSGPWGAALLAAGLVAGTLAEKLFKSGEAAEDLTQKLIANEAKTKASEKANAIFEKTLDGVERALRENKKAQDDLSGAQDTGAEATLKAAQAARIRLVEIRKVILALAEQANAEYEAAQSQTFGAAGGAGAAAARQIYAQRKAQADELVKRAQDAVTEAEKQVEVGKSLVIVERAQADAAERTNRAYDKKVEAARLEAISRGKVGATLDAEIRKIEKARAAELKRIADRDRAERKSASTRAQTGRKINEADAREIVKSIGGTVTSGQRSRAKQQELYDNYIAGRGPLAAKPGTSAHETGNAVDVRKSPGITLAKLRKAFEDRGVRITEALDEGSHYHIAWASTAKAQAAEARKAETEQKRQVRDDEAFGREREQLQQSIIAAQRSQAKTAQEFADAERARVNSQFNDRRIGIDADLATGKYDQAQADELNALNEYNRLLQLRNIAVDEDLRFLEEQAQKGRVIAATRENELQTSIELAANDKERAALERELLRIKHDQREAELRIALAKAATAGDAEKVQQLERELANLPRERRADEIGLQEMQTGRSPLARYARELNRSDDELQYAFEDAVVQKLQAIEDGIADGLAEKIGIKDPFLKSLMKLFIQDVIMKPIAEALKNASQSGGGGGGLLNTIASFATALFSGGGSGGGGSGSVGSGLSSIGNLLAGRASGGNVMAGKPYMVGETGKEMFVPAQSGKIYPTGALNAAASRGGGGTVVQQTFVLDARGGVVTQDLLRQVNAISSQKASAAGRVAYENSPSRIVKRETLGT